MFSLNSARRALPPLLLLLLCTDAFVLFAQPAATKEDIQQLQKLLAAQQEQIAAQQKQINELRSLLNDQPKVQATELGTLERPAILKHEPERAGPLGLPERTSGAGEQSAATPSGQQTEAGGSAIAAHLGPITIAPTGFVDYSQVWRSKTVTSGLPTNFAAIPFKDTVEGHRRQTLASAANSRIGVQINATVSSLKILGVIETDFLGYQPGNISTTTNSYGLRLRLAFADAAVGKWEILAGQDWSMLTPGRKDISALPSGLMLTQDLDPNIQSGLVWARSPQFRAVYRPKKGVALGASLESGETYVGGSSGAGTITLPSALSPNYFNQVDLGSGGLGVPSPHLDYIGKVAFDWTRWNRNGHLEIAGMMNQFAFYNPLSNQRFSVVGGGVSLNAGMEVSKSVLLYSSNFYSDGGGRFIYGEAPALIVEGNGAPSLVHSMSTMDGVEYQATPKWKVWAFYGGTYIDKNVAIDPSNGKPVGYGYTGSPDSQNRSIQEVTAGFTRVFHRDPVFGSFQFSGQYSWLVRHPSYVASGRPASANLNILYLGIRYLLPAAPQASK